MALSALALAPPASADCAALPPLEKSLAAAEVVFVGTVTRLEHDARAATFRVEEAWKGTVGSTVVVNGSGVSLKGMEDAERRGLGIGSSVDRSYRLGVRYLVVPHGASGDLLLDNSCSATQRYASELEAFGPPGEASSPPSPSPPAAGQPDEPSEGRAGSPSASLRARSGSRRLRPRRASGSERRSALASRASRERS